MFFLSGTAAYTNFSVECTCWQEYEAEGGLSYEYRVRQMGRQRSLLFYFGEAASSTPTMLPVGAYSSDFLDECVLLVYDSIGDYWTLTIPVTVYPPPGPREETLDEIFQVSFGNDPSVSRRIEAGDFQGASTAMYSYVSILNVPPDFVSTINQVQCNILNVSRISSRI